MYNHLTQILHIFPRESLWLEQEKDMAGYRLLLFLDFHLDSRKETLSYRNHYTEISQQYKWSRFL